MRYFLELAYKGTNYHGWQVQNNSETIQGELNKVFSLILSEDILIVGAGRTDTGVHADYYVAHFDSKHESLENNTGLLHKINRFLSPDFVVYTITKVADDAHSRFQAILRTYNYYIHHEKNPFNQELSWYLNQKPDYDKMNECAELLTKVADFKSFAKLHSDVKTTICDVRYAKWEQKNNVSVFTITADRFLRNMVRSIVGTLLDVGYGKMDISAFKKVIKAKERSAAGTSVPAKGLFLSDILYPSDIFLRRRNKNF